MTSCVYASCESSGADKNKGRMRMNIAGSVIFLRPFLKTLNAEIDFVISKNCDDFMIF